MSRVLFLTSAHPGGRGFIGAGEGISASSLLALIAAGHEVHVICFARPEQQPDPAVVAHCASYRTVEQTAWQSLLGILRGWRWGSLWAPWFFVRCSPRNLRVVADTLQEGEFSRIWIDFPSSLAFAPHVTGRDIDYFVHDVISQKVARRPLLSWLAKGVTAVERRLTGFCRRCYVLSEKDRDLLVGFGYAGEIVVVPPQDIQVGAVRADRTAASVVQEFVSGRDLVFFGNMRRPENHWSLMHFLAFHFRPLRRECPEMRLWILGLSPRRSLRWLARWIGGVEVTGAVDDPLPVFRAATLCVVPLRYGAGVKIKVLQMLEAGATVVATPVAAEGVAPNERLLVVDEAHFAETILRLHSAASVPGQQKASV